MKLVFTFKHYRYDNMTYGKIYYLLKESKILDKTLIFILDDNLEEQWFNLTYFNDINEIRKLKLNNII